MQSDKLNQDKKNISYFSSDMARQELSMVKDDVPYTYGLTKSNLISNNVKKKMRIKEPLRQFLY
jgi:hypothetical protein